MQSLHRARGASAPSLTQTITLIAGGNPLPVILEAIVQCVEAEHPEILGSILLLDDSGRHLLHGAAPQLPDFYVQAINGIEVGPDVGSCGTAAFLNERVIVSDIETDPRWANFKALASQAGLASCWSEPIRSSEGRVLGTFAMYHRRVATPTDDDIASIAAAAHLASIAIERKLLEDDLRTRTLEAQSAAQAKSEFLANMSHEIRTPLTAILGFSNLLERTSGMPQQAAPHLARIKTAGAALLQIVNDILDLSKLESGQLTLDPAPFNPNAFVEETADLARLLAEEKGLSLKVELAPDLPVSLLGDSARLRQVLLNLLSNAVKFTQTGSVCVQAFYDRAAGGVLEIRVADTGSGIAQERQSLLFKRFSQIESVVSRRHGGTGLGLAICKSLVERMDGQIGVESRSGEGADFWFRVPAGIIETAPPGALASAQHFTFEAMRLLVVDDLEANRYLVRAVLEPFGMAVFEAASGPEAIDLACGAPFDIILLDLQMVGMDGLTAARAIRARSRLNRQTPILAFSANVLPEEKAACALAGMADHISKPIDTDELLTKIALWSRKSAAAGG
jgi:signal transduction histidine kinase/CheY-like chemotaxis protein